MNRNSFNLYQGNNLIDFDKLLGLLKTGFMKSKTSQGKNIVLIIGNTGSGKSTFINYQLGCELQKTYSPEYGTIVTTKSTAIAEIGHEIEAKTLYPEVYESARNQPSLCDCPGIGENRGKEEQIAITFNMEYVVKSAQNVAAVIVTIDLAAIESGRSEAFIKVSKTLAKLFKDPEQIANSVLFVVTKSEGQSNPIAAEYIINKVTRIIKTLEKQSDGLAEKFRKFFSGAPDQDNDQINELNEALRTLRLIKLENTVIANVLDDGKCRADIWLHLKALSCAVKEAFNFNDYDPERVSFCENLLKFVNKEYSILYDRFELPKKIADYHNQIIQENENILSSERQFDWIKGIGTETLQQQISTLEQTIQENKDLMAKLQQIKLFIEHDVSNYKNELKTLDSNEEILYEQYSVNEKRSGLGKYWGWTRHNFEYNKGIPYAKALMRTNEKNGYFKDVIENPAEGNFKATYVSKWGCDGNATVAIYINKKLKPENAMRIDTLKKHIIDKENESFEIDNRIINLTSKIQQITNTVAILKGKVNSENSLVESQLARLKLAVQTHEKKISKLKEDLATASQQLSVINDYLKNNDVVSTYSMINKIARIVEFNTPIMNNFVQLYEKLLQEEPDLADSIKVNVVENSSNSAKSEHCTNVDDYSTPPTRVSKSIVREQQHCDECDVPNDGSCLFWAIGLAYLLPVVHDDYHFGERFSNLFGHERATQMQMNSVQTILQNFNPHDCLRVFDNQQLTDLVTRMLRSKVVDHIKQHGDFFQPYYEGNVSFDQYLENMLQTNYWAGSLEMHALSRMLNCNIIVRNDMGLVITNVTDNNHETTLTIAYVNGVGIIGDNPNHYHFYLSHDVLTNLSQSGDFTTPAKNLMREMKDTVERWKSNNQPNETKLSSSAQFFESAVTKQYLKNVKKLLKNSQCNINGEKVTVIFRDQYYMKSFCKQVKELVDAGLAVQLPKSSGNDSATVSLDKPTYGLLLKANCDVSHTSSNELSTRLI